MKKMLFCAAIGLAVASVSLHAEETREYEIGDGFVLELTGHQKYLLDNYQKYLNRTRNWARYDYYAAANAEQAKGAKAVFMGNSITQGWLDSRPEFFAKNDLVGRGISGQTTYQMLARMQSDVVDLAPEYVVILAGTNDMACNDGVISKHHIVENIKSMCEIAKANGIKPVVCSVLPVYEYPWRKELGLMADHVRELNVLLKDYATQSGALYVDYHSATQDERGGLPEHLSHDGVHLKADGYAIIEGVILEALGL